MELAAVTFMIVAGCAIAVFVMIAMAIARGESRGPVGQQPQVPDRDRVAASILFRILTAGGMPPDEALREIRMRAGIIAPPTSGIHIATWGDRFAMHATPEQRARLLDVAVQLVAAPGRPIPLLQYVDLLDLSFSLGFRTDALAKLRERYGFDYVDHAKAGRPREADRVGRTTFFARDDREPRELLAVLGMEGTPSRQQIIAAYRKLAAQHHPDKFHEAAEGVRSNAAMRFIEITRAYEALLAIYKE
ncbi:MAG TPA: J domain-containing protein [Thermoanaerobaculia bacterium]